MRRREQRHDGLDLSNERHVLGLADQRHHDHRKWRCLRGHHEPPVGAGSLASNRVQPVKTRCGKLARVALEAGSSTDIIFKHYRELVTEEDAQEWFSIVPSEGWLPPESEKRRCSPRRRREKSLVDSILG